ncbi:MerR family transcriptional regulator [Wenjunlia vitaminophila]|uniref:MerR family transcriptional regulator n=1 Tax=Wenjunlia vitaminophila TaxID=76728 RepID=A0A0T6LPW4_WENVI|nr:MerR family transcriptional regulator [Wenjunlia vitaminophila]KRV47953.1 MerR family transcriptional regulator [Wenjunlia vitaminophila]
MRSTGDGTAAGSGYPPRGPQRSPRLCAEEGAVAGGSGPHQGLVGYRGPTACAAAGITYRQLDYWARTGLVEPSVRPAHGSGTQRLYSFRDVVVLKIVKRLLDTGVSLQNIRTAVRHLRSRDLSDLARMTLMCDGATVYECASPDEVVDLLQGGQGVFGIAVGVVWREVEAALAQLHGERVDTGETLIGHNPQDELARRRNRAG